jgi:imidazole glycerol-phosphate synthase subunit HisH
MSRLVAVVDYGMCNLDSVRRALEEVGGRVVVTDQTADVEAADVIVLPGVGAFPDAMRNVRDRDLDKVLEDQVVGEGAPFLGICLGMQLLATVGYEGRQTPGLGWIDGEVRRLVPAGADRRIPHVGWNEVNAADGSPLFAGIEPGSDFYFVHSYHLACDVTDDIAATTPYCGGFASAVSRGNVHAVQFHPEKSQRNGLRLLQNVLAL